MRDMKMATTTAKMTLRGSGVLLVVLGVVLWTGNALQLVTLHEVLGFVLVLSLWTLAFIASRSGVPAGLVAVAAAWGVVAPVLGLTQERLLTGELHWLIQVLHLLVGVGAMGLGEGLAAMIKRAGTPVGQPVRIA